MTKYAQNGAALDYSLELLSECAPESVRRARAALEILLQGVRSSPWREVAWACSNLTPDGFPVELTFSSLAGHKVRYALEVAGPEMPEREGIRTAFQLYRQLAGRQASVQVECAMAEMQGAHELSYGAWFGGAHGATSDRYKIYSEIPRGASPQKVAPGIVERGLPLPHCQPVPVMFGFQPDTGVREVYFRTPGLAAEDIGRLLWEWGLGQRYCETLELMEATCGRPVPRVVIEGFSVASDSGGDLRAVSLFATASALFGSDANIRRTLLQLARSRGWAPTLYERVTESLQHRDELPAYHGVISWIVPCEGPLELRIGLRAPEVPTAQTA